MSDMREVKAPTSQDVASLPPENSVQPPAAEDGTTYPEGGLQGWLVVVGSFCASMSAFGIINTASVFESYLSENQLADESKSSIGWIFSMYLFTLYAIGLFVGPCFDRYGPRILITVGSVIIVANPMVLSVCTEYYQFFLSFAIFMGVGGALLSSPAIGAVGHYFFAKRGLATGVASSAGAMGGLIFPLILRETLPSIGYPWSMRILGFILLFLAAPAILFIRARLPPKEDVGIPLPDIRIFQEPKFLLCVIGIFFMEFGVLMPLTYIVSFANFYGQNMSDSYILPAIMNAGSVLGRPIPGLIADRMGRFNTLICTMALCAVAVLGLWLPSGSSQALLIVFVFVLGFASGGNVSLIPVCVGQLCESQQYGRYLSGAMIGASFGTLAGIPIGGALVGVGDQQTGWTALVLFSGLSYAVSVGCYVAVRVLAVGWKLRIVF